MPRPDHLADLLARHSTQPSVVRRRRENVASIARMGADDVARRMDSLAARKQASTSGAWTVPHAIIAEPVGWHRTAASHPAHGLGKRQPRTPSWATAAITYRGVWPWSRSLTQSVNDFARGLITEQELLSLCHGFISIDERR